MPSTNVFIHGTQEQQKNAIQDDLGPVPEVTVDFMLKYIIPNSNVNVEATAQRLIRENIWSNQTGWSAFNGKSPKKLAQPTKDGTKLKETEVFSRLQGVHADIITNTVFMDGYTRKPTLVFRQLPDNAPLSDTNVRTRPDCCGELENDQEIHTKAFDAVRFPKDGTYNPNGNTKTKSAKGSRYWFDIAYVEEYKLGNSTDDLNDNVWKLLWSLHYMMHVDHRRRFAFGLTIENESSRIWFCCRQTILVSEPFNFNKDATQLIHLISSLAYATPIQLGYDPTMKLVWPKDLASWQYEIETTGLAGTAQTYQTRQVVSDTSYNIRGRASRVYIARATEGLPKSTSPDVILKDSWIDVDRTKEGDTLTTLLKDASDNEKKLFLTVLAHGIVQINGKDDSTGDLILKGQDITVVPRATRTKKTIPEEVSESDSSSESEDDWEDFRADEPDLKVGNNNIGNDQGPVEAAPNQTASNSSRLFALYQEPKAFSRSLSISSSHTGPSRRNASDALPHHDPHQMAKQVIYLPKHHYRIVFSEVGQSLMSLAESKNATLTIIYQVIYDITLALQFMAKKGYVHRDVSVGNIIIYEGGAKLADLEFAKKYDSGKSAYIRTGTYSFMATEVAKGKYWFPTTLKPFAHNPLHDLESLWWVGVWCVLWHHPSSDDKHYRGKPILDDLYEQETLGKQLFPTYFNPMDNTRTEELHHKELTNFYDHAPPHQSKRIKSLFGRLNNFRTLLSAAYKRLSLQSHVDAAYFTQVLKVNTKEKGNKPIYDYILLIFETHAKRSACTMLPLQFVINQRNGGNDSEFESSV